MTDILQQIRELKTQAKNRRDLGRYDRAVRLLSDAISIAQGELNASNVGEWRAALASELADCYGLLGGVERRWALHPQGSTDPAEHLRRSLQAYDEGYKFEADPAFGLTSTYNRVNRLLTRILKNPSLLTADGTGGADDGSVHVRSELHATAKELERQLTTERRGDFWALADLALIKVLLGEQDAATAYAMFESELRPDFAYQSALSAVMPLAALDLPTALELRRAQERLEKRLRSLQTG